MDDEPHIRDILCKLLNRFGLETKQAKDGQDAVIQIKNNNFAPKLFQLYSQSRFFEEASSGIIGQEFSAGSTGSTGSSGNGVRSCGSDPAFHAQESQDDVSSQANSLKLAF